LRGDVDGTRLGLAIAKWIADTHDAPLPGPSGMKSKDDFPASSLCAHLLRKVDARLLELLGSLRADEWDLAGSRKCQICQVLSRSPERI
jgi:hypothetical protein